MRGIPKVEQNATPQGQAGTTLATLAARHRVSQRWLRLIAYGTLDDPAFVLAIRKAAKTPRLWQLVAPAALNALFIPTSKIERLGGSLDDLLAGLFEMLELLRHPINQNFARQTSALEQVNQSLDFHLQERIRNETDRGRRNIKSTDGARQKKSENANERAARLLVELEKRRGTKAAAYIRIAAAETKISGKEVTPDAVKQVIKRSLKRPPSHSTRQK